MRIQFEINDRIVALWKRTISRRNTSMALGVVAALPLVLFAADVPNVFQPNTPISSSQVNSNFSSLDGRLDVYEESIYVDEDNGNVGIGTTSPGAKLDVDGDNTNSQLRLSSQIGNGVSSNELIGGIDFYSNDPDAQGISAGIMAYSEYTHGVTQLPSRLSFFTTPTGSLTAQERLTIKETGNVGIGTTSPSERLHVAGNVIADDYLYYSDARLKTDVEPLENADESIACLQGVKYRRSDASAPQELQIGLIAQEVEACFPELVSTGPDGYKSVSYARLVAPLIENAKLQQDVNVSQQDEIARLKADLTTTNARLARLEALLDTHR